MSPHDQIKFELEKHSIPLIHRIFENHPAKKLFSTEERTQALELRHIYWDHIKKDEYVFNISRRLAIVNLSLLSPMQTNPLVSKEEKKLIEQARKMILASLHKKG